MTTTIRDKIRTNLLKRCVDGVIGEHRKMTFEDILDDNWSSDFETLMRNRMVIGFFRYGKSEYDLIGSIKKRIEKYVIDGNQEHLVDCANLLMLEFKNGNHPKKHFTAIDDGEHTEKLTNVC